MYETQKGNSEDNLKQNSPKGRFDPSVEVAESIANATGVSPATIKRDAKQKKAIGTIAKNVGEEAKEEILSGKSKLSMKKIQAIASLPAGTVCVQCQEVLRAKIPGGVPKICVGSQWGHGVATWGNVT